MEAIFKRQDLLSHPQDPTKPISGPLTGLIYITALEFPQSPSLLHLTVLLSLNPLFSHGRWRSSGGTRPLSCSCLVAAASSFLPLSRVAGRLAHLPERWRSHEVAVACPPAIVPRRGDNKASTSGAGLQLCSHEEVTAGPLAVARSCSGAAASSGGADLATAARGKAGSGGGAGREAGSSGGGMWEGRIQWARAGIPDPAMAPLFSHLSLPEVGKPTDLAAVCTWRQDPASPAADPAAGSVQGWIKHP